MKNTNTADLRASLIEARDWFESQAKAVSKGCGSSYELHDLRVQRDALDAALAAPAQAVPAPGVPSEQQAHDMGAKGAPATEAERLLFEAWMRGHCWALCATWEGTGYRSAAERGGDIDPHAMATRRLWAAWRDRAALAASPTAATVTAAPAQAGEYPEPSPTAGMSIAQRIAHVGGRNPPGSTYIEFGSIQAVEALVRQVLRDQPARGAAQAAPVDAAVLLDAERYQWLRRECSEGYLRASGFILNCDEPANEWDAAIDAARAAQEGK